MRNFVFKTVLSWVLALAIALFFLQAAILFKFRDPVGENIIFATIAQKSGISLFEPYIRYLVGIAEVITAFLLLFPRTRCLGAVGSFGILTGALGFHLSPWLGTQVPVAIGSSKMDGGTLFYIAITLWIFSLILLWMHKTCIVNFLSQKNN